MIPRVCPLCDGTGIDPKYFNKCFPCDGSGIVWEKDKIQILYMNGTSIHCCEHNNHSEFCYHCQINHHVEKNKL